MCYGQQYIFNIFALRGNLLSLAIKSDLKETLLERFEGLIQDGKDLLRASSQVFIRNMRGELK